MMKKLTAILLALVLLCSCSDEGIGIIEAEETASAPVNPYIKRDPAGHGNQTFGFSTDGSSIYFSAMYAYNDLGYTSKRIFKYNTDTGMYLHACSDPLCAHDHYCPLHNMVMDSTIKIRNHKVYYYTAKSAVDGLTMEYVEYDMMSNRYRVLESVKDHSIKSNPNFMFTDTHRYYFSMVGYDDSTKSYSMTMMRQNLTTLKTEIIKEKADSYVPALATEYALFFKSIGGYELRDGETLEVIGTLETKAEGLTYDGKHIYAKWLHQDQDKTVITCINPQTYESEDFIFDGVIQFYWLGDDYIYFTYNNKKSLGIDSNIEGDIRNAYPDSDVYKLDKASLEVGEPAVTQLCAFDGEWEKTYMKNNAFVELNGALYSPYYSWDLNADGSQFNSTNAGRDYLLRIDCESGEISIVSGTVQ